MDSHNIHVKELTKQQPSSVHDANNCNTIDKLANEEGQQQHIHDTFRYLIRCSIVLVCLSLAFVAGIYLYSSIIVLEATNLLCPIYDAETVHQHNLENESSQGIGGCWRIDRAGFNNEAVYDFNFDVYSVSIDKKPDFDTMVVCIMYGLLGVCLLLIGIQNGIYIASDCYYSVCKKVVNPRVVKVRNMFNTNYNSKRSSSGRNEDKKNSTESDADKRGCGEESIHNKKLSSRTYDYNKWYERYKKFYRKHYYDDSKWKILSTAGGELIEILIQFYGLCLYGGVDILDIQTVQLGQEHELVLLFAVIVGLDGILTGIAWIMYILWHNTWHGALFFALIFFIDAAFELIYVIFPLIYLTRSEENGNFFEKRSLGLLKQTNSFNVVQSLIALMFVTRKCWRLLKKLDPASVEFDHLVELKRIENGIHNPRKPWIYTKQLIERNELRNFQLASASHSKSVSATNDCNYSDSKNSNQNSRFKSSQAPTIGENQTFRKIFVLLIGFTFFSIGLGTLASFTTDINNNYKPKCLPNGHDDFINQEWKSNNPEISMFFDQNCEMRVIHIFNEYPCNCRKFKLSYETVESNVDSTVIARIFEKWTMLEAVSISNNIPSPFSQIDLNFTSSMVKLEYLRILVINGLTISHIHDDVGKYMHNLGMSTFPTCFCTKHYSVCLHIRILYLFPQYIRNIGH